MYSHPPTDAFIRPNSSHKTHKPHWPSTTPLIWNGNNSQIQIQTTEKIRKKLSAISWNICLNFSDIWTNCLLGNYKWYLARHVLSKCIRADFAAILECCWILIKRHSPAHVTYAAQIMHELTLCSIFTQHSKMFHVLEEPQRTSLGVCN